MASGPKPFDREEFERLFGDLFGSRQAGGAPRPGDGADGRQILRVRLPLSFRQRERGGTHRLKVRWDAQATRVIVKVPPSTRRGTVLRLRGVHVATRAFDVHVELTDPTLGDIVRRPPVAALLAALTIALGWALYR